MATAAEHDRQAPGVHRHADEAPLKRATVLATELGAALCTSTPEADELLVERSALPPLTVEAIDELQNLADRVASARRIVASTVDRAAVEVGERMAGTGAGVAIHPAAVRDRAAAVVRARAALEAAAEELHAGEALVEAQRSDAAVADEPATPAHAATPAPAPTPAPTGASAPPARRRFLGLGRRRAERRYEEDTSESTSLLQQMAASTDEAFGARRAHAVRDDANVLLRAKRDRAQEELRVAERAWRDLAGDDPVEDVEHVVRRFDPQHQDALAVAYDTVGVRAVGTLLQRAVDRWDERWRSLAGDSPAPDPSGLDDVIEQLVRPVVLVEGAVGHADRVAEVAPAAPVLVVEPRAAS